MLKSAPSLSVYCDSVDGVQERDLLIGSEENLERTVTTGENIEAIGSGDFSFVQQENMVTIEEGDEEDEKIEKGPDGVKEEGLNRIEEEDQNEREGVEPAASPPMYLAAGLGINGYDLKLDEIRFDFPSFDGENGDAEEYYRKMLDDYPLHPLLLRNFAQFLESKGELHEAVDYYHQYCLVEPDDGEILANYAKLVWRLHQDRTTASHYFEHAVRASPQDSNVLAAYASFLWEVDDEGVDAEGNSQETELAQLNGTADSGSSSLRADLVRGDKMCEYATLQWDVHRNREKAVYYFEKAVEASPEDSDVLAAYARFLWEAEDEDDEF